MRAIVVEEGQPTRLRDVPPSFVAPEQGGEGVVVDVEWSSLNYKDGMALGGDRGVVRTSPLVPGIDLVGVVRSVPSGTGDVPGSGGGTGTEVAVGDRVVVTGAGHGERRHGGYAEQAVVDPDSVVVLPDAMTSRRAAAIGTAGVTAMLSVLRLERDVAPGDGPVVVTGAAGGVGSVAIAVLSRLGYSVTASSGRVDEQGDYLRRLGAADLIDRRELGEPGRPLQRARWAGAVDSVGSQTLASLLAQTRPGGVVTACGLAQGSDLPTTVLPFILRGIGLAGIDSVDAPAARRRRVWQRLASDLDLELLDSMTTEIALDDVIAAGPRVLEGRVRGRTVVRVNA